MPVIVRNQVPQHLDYGFAAPLTGDIDPVGIIDANITSKLLTPVTAASPVKVLFDGKAVSDQDITQAILETTDDAVVPDADRLVQGLYEACLARYSTATTLAPSNVFVTQALLEHKLDLPDPRTIYVPEDAIQAAKDRLRKTIDDDEFFATVAAWQHPRTLGVMALTPDAYHTFATWCLTQAQALANVPADTMQLVNDFAKTKLDGILTPIALRGTVNDGNDEMSFARLLPYLILLYATTVSDDIAFMPYDLSELVLPTSVTFLDVDALAHATPRQARDAWKDLTDAIVQRPQVLSRSAVTKLDAIIRAKKNAKQRAAATSLSGQGQMATRALHRRFSKQAPTSLDLTRYIERIMAHMTQVSKSQNIYKRSHRTFARANRRHPDDIDRTGLSVSTSYKPDIHIYVDTSGSISSDNYEAAVKTVISCARRFGVNMYFTSFSHVMTQSYLVHVKGHSTREVYAEIESFPKVTGGTDYLQVWNYIQNSARRRRELSIIITDFEYWAPNVQVTHPKNLYYFPCANMSWQAITANAKTFCQTMVHIDPTVRNKLLF